MSGLGVLAALLLGAACSTGAAAGLVWRWILVRSRRQDAADGTSASDGMSLQAFVDSPRPAPGRDWYKTLAFMGLVLAFALGVAGFLFADRLGGFRSPVVLSLFSSWQWLVLPAAAIVLMLVVRWPLTLGVPLVAVLVLGVIFLLVWLRPHSGLYPKLRRVEVLPLSLSPDGGRMELRARVDSSKSVFDYSGIQEASKIAEEGNAYRLRLEYGCVSPWLFFLQSCAPQGLFLQSGYLFDSESVGGPVASEFELQSETLLWSSQAIGASGKKDAEVSYNMYFDLSVARLLEAESWCLSVNCLNLEQHAPIISSP
ncbi:MAG: hypothetical protein D6B26_06700 [Spirochaetaceae bacterium]|nr:MAG: hypothetical protein D6B26_06700 [Spirochaetaceae bacterium]